MKLSVEVIIIIIMIEMYSFVCHVSYGITLPSHYKKEKNTKKST